jgi:hypothetical protein
VKHRRRKPAARRKTVTGDDLDSLAGRTRVATVKAGDAARRAAESAVDQARETAKEVFEHIKAAHARAEKGVE